MDSSAYPFPLAAASSHHSSYHRFLLGADPSVIAPFPKPYCVGALASEMGRLSRDLNLARWRKLFHAAFPWVPGFGPGHYDLGNVPPHRPLPREYARPARRFGAFDFVQVADPCVSALALVAGDRRVLDRFRDLADDFCARVEAGACARNPGSSGGRATGRLLEGQFAEPNNRWLMPFLHVHARVLNFTSFAESPGKLECVDSAALARAGHAAKTAWVTRQAEALEGLGYRASVGPGAAPALRVDGVCVRLLAAIEAPRIAVLRILERMIGGDGPPCVERLGAELAPAVIAAMAEQLESVLARSLCAFKPAKVGIPSEGPWRAAVREHVGRVCPESLATLDAAAARAKATLLGSAVFPAPALDAAHCHAPLTESFEAGMQHPLDPELVAGAQEAPGRPSSGWLVREFVRTLGDLNARIARRGTDEPLAPYRRMLAAIDGLSEGASPEQLRQSELLLGVELDRRARQVAPDVDAEWGRRPGGRQAHRLVSLEELFENASLPRLTCEQEIGGRSL